MTLPGTVRPRKTGQSTICPNCGASISEEKLRIEKTKLLLVEGKDEEEFFSAVADRLSVEDLQIAGIAGKDRIRQNLKALVVDPGFREVVSLGVVRDADANPGGAFASVKDALSAAGLPCPRVPTRPAKGPPKVNVMILPSSAKKGSLEDLCLQTITDDPAAGCVDDLFDCLVRDGVKAPKALSKARVRAFLATRQNPTLPLGLAAQRGYWPLDHEALQEIRDFLLSM